MATVTVETTGPDGKITVAQVPVDDSSVNADTLRQQATQALITNRAYVALANPTAAQTTAEVKALARQANGIIRLLLGLLDGTD